MSDNFLPEKSGTKWKYVVAAAVVAGGAYYFWPAGESAKSAAPAANVSAASVVRKDVPTQVPLVGTVVPYETVSVKSRLDSQIMNVLFHDGDYVKEGQTLFELDDRTIKAQLAQLQADIAKEKAQLVNNRLQYERAQKLVKTNAVAQAQVDEAKAAYEAQVAQVKAAEANYDNTKVQLTYTVITAPITGRTGTINATRGNNVKTNDAVLVTINQIRPIRVQFAIPQRYYDSVKSAMDKGAMEVHAKPKEAQLTADGKLEYIDNSIDVTNGTFAARADFANEDEKLWPGMFVNVTMDLGVQKNVLTIPAVAVQGDENNRFVFAIDAKTNKAARTPVEVMQNDGNVAVITKGLAEGDMVVTDGMLRVTDGATVEIAPPKATADKDKPASEDKPADKGDKKEAAAKP